LAVKGLLGNDSTKTTEKMTFTVNDNSLQEEEWEKKGEYHVHENGFLQRE
jgi:hypothetical protein